jgi:hypothetical protein
MTDASSLRPASGVRYAVELATHEGDRAVYRGAVHLPDVSWPLEVVVEPGRAEARVEGPEDVQQQHAKPAAALVKAAVKLPRTPESGPPPRRIVRWRG